MEITSQDFERMFRAKNSLCRKWAELEVGKVYIIMGNQTIDTKYGESMILIRYLKTTVKYGHKII